jgi:hypothetical protein
MDTDEDGRAYLFTFPCLAHARAGDGSWENLKQLRKAQKIELFDMGMKMA